MVAHFHAVADASPVPVVIYNIPIRTGRNLGPEGMLELAQHTNIVGREAGGRRDRHRHARDPRRRARATSRCSVATTRSSSRRCSWAVRERSARSAHLCTERFVAMIECGLAAKVDDGRAHAEALLPVVQACFAEPNPAVFKGVLHAQGRIPTPDVRLPLVAASARCGRRAVAAVAAAQ